VKLPSQCFEIISFAENITFTKLQKEREIEGGGHLSVNVCLHIMHRSTQNASAKNATINHTLSKNT